VAACAWGSGSHSLLARDHYPPDLSLLFEVLRMPAVLPATVALIRPDLGGGFTVTPKGRTGDARDRTPVPRLLSWLAAACSVGLVWFTATLLGLTVVTYATPWAPIGAAGFMAMNLALLLAAIGRIRSTRFASNRRAATRLPVQVPIRLAGQLGELLDLSVTGARVAVPEPVEAGDGELWLELGLEGGPVELQVETRRVTNLADGRQQIGLEFALGQEAAVADLVVAVFSSDVPRASTSREPQPGVVWENAVA
jgi:hypothetical protein